MATRTTLPLKMFANHIRSAANGASNMQRICLIRNPVTTNTNALVVMRQHELVLQRFYSTEKPQQNADEPSTSDATDSEATKKLQGELENLTKELAAEKAKGNELLDKYRRSLAESENMRVRLNKQISDAKIFGIQSFCKDLLEVADTLGHATKAVPQDKLADNADLKNLYEGLTMTRASLLQVFKRHGLEPLDPINQKFDPNFHEALFQKEDPNTEPNTVVEVTKLGYKLHERCIRPALVGVSKC